MPLSERVQRKIVPRRGFCSVSPAGDALLISGNGAMTIETACGPYSEQIVFRYESLFTPHKRPFEAPNIAGIFSQVRQNAVGRKIPRGRETRLRRMAQDRHHPGVLRRRGTLHAPGLSQVRAGEGHLRTVDFESTELRVHWTDERGEWVRRTFASRPDDVVVQWLTAPKGQPLNIRITMQRSAPGGRGMGGMGGGMPGSDGRGGAPAGAQSNARQDFNEQRLIFKGIFDPTIDNSGYAGVTRVVRDGGSACMEGDTLVVENAASVMLLTRIERLAAYSDERVELLWRALEELTPDYPALLERARKIQSEMLNRVTVDFGGAA